MSATSCTSLVLVNQRARHLEQRCVNLVTLQLVEFPVQPLNDAVLVGHLFLEWDIDAKLSQVLAKYSALNIGVARSDSEKKKT